MAIPCQGFTFTWGGSALLQVRELEVDLARGLPTGRTTNWTPNFGEIRLSGFSPSGLPTSEYGRRKRLTIIAPSGTGTITVFDSDCIYQDQNIQAAANDAMRFAYVFRVMDTVDAPTNP